jgi:hypothetical protein
MLGALRHGAQLALVVLFVLALGGCGSGAVGGGESATPPVVGPLSVLPATATMYSGVPTTFVVSGGTGTYSVISSDQNVIPNQLSLTGGSFAIVANPVGTETPVTLTVRDTAGTQQSVTLNVKPRTVGSTITITPTSSQSAICGAAICSGGDAEVAATLSQQGAPLVGRVVLFEAISGDFRFITSPVGAAETLATSMTTVTDSTGTARVRIRILSNAVPQTALLQITDTVSGAFQRASFTIAVANTAVLSAQPSVITFRGLTSATCARNISADVIVVGGRPPYSISNPGSFGVFPILLQNSGDRFTVTATGQCATGAKIAVVDALGASATVDVSNSEGPGIPQSNPLVVGPNAVSLTQSCSSIASVIVAGGAGSYFAVAGNTYLTVAISGNTASVSRANPSPTAPGPTATTIPVAISDGREVVTVQVSVPSVPCTSP